jgi:hypothetical protein
MRDADSKAWDLDVVPEVHGAHEAPTGQKRFSLSRLRLPA